MWAPELVGPMIATISGSPARSCTACMDTAGFRGRVAFDNRYWYAINPTVGIDLLEKELRAVELLESDGRNWTCECLDYADLDRSGTGGGGGGGCCCLGHRWRLPFRRLSGTGSRGGLIGGVTTRTQYETDKHDD